MTIEKNKVQGVKIVKAMNVTGSILYASSNSVDSIFPQLEVLRKEGKLTEIDHTVLIYEYGRDKTFKPVLLDVRQAWYKNGWHIAPSNI